jgi:hypothetical protein
MRYTWDGKIESIEGGGEEGGEDLRLIAAETFAVAIEVMLLYQCRLPHQIDRDCCGRGLEEIEYREGESRVREGREDKDIRVIAAETSFPAAIEVTLHKSMRTTSSVLVGIAVGEGWKKYGSSAASRVSLVIFPLPHVYTSPFSMIKIK